MLDIPDQMKLFVNDYKMLLVEVRKNNLKLHNIDNRDLFNLLDIFLNNNESRVKRREQALHYAKENQVNKTVVMTVASTANCQLDYEELIRNADLVCTDCLYKYDDTNMPCNVSKCEMYEEKPSTVIDGGNCDLYDKGVSE